MFTLHQADTADELWLKAAAMFHSGGLSSQQSSRGGNTQEVLHVAMALHNPRQRWIATREPAINPAFAIAEVVWIVAGRKDSAFLNYFNRRLPKFAGKGPEYHGAYGFRLRNAFGIDQLKRATSALKDQPNTRQIVLQVWDSKADLPLTDGRAASEDIPCNVVAMLKVREGKLEWTQVMRSNDLFLGLPHNLVQFTTLQEVLAGWIGVGVGSYHHLSDSLHLYEHDDYTLGQLSPQPCPPNNDRLDLAEDESERSFQELSNIIDQIIQTNVSSGALLKQLSETKLSQGFRNMLTILVAEGCRRRQNLGDAVVAAAQCENPCLAFLWQRWLKRQTT